MSKHIEPQTEHYDSIFSLFVRVFWALIGNFIAFFILFAIVNHKGSQFYLMDLIYFGVIAALILARYIDIKFWDKADDNGQPITMLNWRKYTLKIMILATSLWLLAHLLNALFFNK
ncbi:MAG: hypothetical protein A2Y12_04150 [Planctomycetes bacterium GWF2_42_9]|nr:MAG: hypothetical protein A2Y12_04150 [Planctomycetes bacterium GWF2_42_9]